MKNKYNKLTCLFGFHDYSKEETVDKHGNAVYLCKVCKRSGYVKWSRGDVGWNDYNKNGELIHVKWNNGDEVWYGEDTAIYMEFPDGSKRWLAKTGNWVKEKPKNWKYEKQI